MTKAEKRRYCSGCSENFYNGNNNLGVKECWCLEKARVVTRYRIGWWTPPAQPGAYTEVRTLDCHVATGRYAQHTTLPSFATEVNRLPRDERARTMKAREREGRS